MNNKANGTKRERDVVKFLRDHGWWAIRAPASQGAADVIAIKRDEKPRMIQVKANKGGPYMNFRPKERQELDLEAIRAGAKAELVWWPPDGNGPRWIDCTDWPEYRSARKEEERLASRT